jgi:hypothetical protein
MNWLPRMLETARDVGHKGSDSPANGKNWTAPKTNAATRYLD